MRGKRSRRAIAIGFASAACTAGAAIAQAPATPAGNYGGGAIALPVDEDTVAKDMLLSIRALASGRIGVDGQVPTNCGQATIRGRTMLAPDGSFTLRGDATRKEDGFTRRTTFTVRGRLTADGGTGTASAALRDRARKGEPRTCKSRTVQWTLRRGAAAAAPAPAPAEATLFGLTAQDGPSAKRAVALHVTKGGRAIDRFILSFRVRCEKRRIDVTDDVNYSPEFDVAADGSFRFVERFRRTYKDAIERTTVVLRGQFDEAGAVAGKLSVTQRYSNRRNGRRIDVCRTGTQPWSARP